MTTSPYLTTEIAHARLDLLRRRAARAAARPTRAERPPRRRWWALR